MSDEALYEMAVLIDDKINKALAGGPGFVVGFAILVVIPMTAFAVAWTLGAGWLWSLVAALWSLVIVGTAVVRQRAKRLKNAKAAIEKAIASNQ